MSYLPQQGNGLEPTETFVDPLPLPLADAVACMPRRPLVNRTAAAATVILRDVRCDLHVAALGMKSAVSKPLSPSSADQMFSFRG